MTAESWIIALPGPIVMAVLGYFIKKWVDQVKESNDHRKKENEKLSEKMDQLKEGLSKDDTSRQLLQQELKLFKGLMDDTLGSFKEHLKYSDRELNDTKEQLGLLKHDHDQIQHKFKDNVT